jgi:hypothetical protein
LAKSIQRKFIAQKAKKGDLVWGTIESQNLFSLKTALSNARKPIRYENLILCRYRYLRLSVPIVENY